MQFTILHRAVALRKGDMRGVNEKGNCVIISRAVQSTIFLQSARR